MAEARMNLNDSIGKKVALAWNRVGTLRYFGNLNLGPGNWCGIELDNPEGDNDGSINGVRYFTCEENHGLFCQVSEILTNLNVPEVNCYIVPSEYTSIGWLLPEDPNCNEASPSEKALPEDPNCNEALPSEKALPEDPNCNEASPSEKALPEDPNCNEALTSETAVPEDPNLALNNMNCNEASTSETSLPEDPNLALNNMTCNETSTSETASTVSLVPLCYDLDFYSKDSVVDLRLYKGKISPTKFENVDYDSDESLGILPLNCLEGESDMFFDITVCSESEHITPALIKETIHSFEEQDKLNITRVLHLSEDQDNLNITQSHLPVEQNDVNETRAVPHNCTFEVVELKEVQKYTNTDDPPSPVACIVPKIIPDLKSDESSVHKTPSSPKYSSTPKHEANYTFVLDEEFLNSEKEFSPVEHFNKTIINGILKKNVFPESDELDNENMLSIQNIDKPIDYQCELNKTFNNVCTNTKFLPSVAAALNTTVTFPEKPDKTFELETTGTDEIAASDSCHVKNDKNIQRNILNTTVCLSKEFEMFNLQERLDYNIKVSDSSLEKKVEYRHFKDISGNTLNTSPIPEVLEKGVVKEKNEYYITQILNTTFEEKLDQLAELPKLMKASQFQTDGIKETKIAKLSKIARSVNSSVAASCGKCTEPDKNKRRKSVFSSRSNSTDALNKPNLRRKTLGSISSQSDDDIVSSQKLSKYAPKQCFASCITSDSQSLKTEASLCSISKKYPVKRNIVSPSVKRNIASPSVKRNIASPSVKKNDSPPVKRSAVTPVETNISTLSVKNKEFRKSISEISSHASSSMYDTSKSIEAKSSVEKKFKIAQLNETINLTHSMPNAQNTNFKKPQIPIKKSSPKPKVPRIPQPTTVPRKTSIPEFRRSSSTVGYEENKISISGTLDKKVLSQGNMTDVGADPGSLNGNRRQYLSIKGDLSDPSRHVPPSQHKKGTKDEPYSLTSHNRPGLSHSNIPALISKKKGPEDKAKTGDPPRKTSLYKFR